MTAATLALAPTLERTLDLLRADVRVGRACIATLRGLDGGGTPWLEVMGPKGTLPDGDWLVAPVPTLRLWVPGNDGAPAAVAALGDGFEDGLRAIVEQALAHVDPADLDWLRALLGGVRAAARPGVPASRPSARASWSGAFRPSKAGPRASPSGIWMPRFGKRQHSISDYVNYQGHLHGVRHAPHRCRLPAVQ